MDLLEEATLSASRICWTSVEFKPKLIPNNPLTIVGPGTPRLTIGIVIQFAVLIEILICPDFQQKFLTIAFPSLDLPYPYAVASEVISPKFHVKFGKAIFRRRVRSPPFVPGDP
jgi:hypothetical protein